MKKIIALTLAVGLLFDTTIQAFETEQQTPTASGIDIIAESNATISGTQKHYSPFTISGEEIRLYTETTISAEEALIIYQDAYALVSAEAEYRGISTSLDDPDFQSFAILYAGFFENGTPELTDECHEFSAFLDYYENAEKNQKIIQSASSLASSSSSNQVQANDANIQEMMPIITAPTVSSGEIISIQSTDSPNTTSSSSTYDANAAAAYASEWWNKTNNDDYPYYADYNGQSTSSNAYNYLDTGRAGQSNPARGWNDCADFVSQCLAAGGVPEIKNGLILPHQNNSNWYYRDGFLNPPSYSWRGANNFYYHWSSRAGVASSSSLLGKGDAVSIDMGSDGDPDHTVIIVSSGSTDSTKYLSAHTTDRYYYYYSGGNLLGFTLSYLYGNGFTLYGYEIDQIF